MTFTKRLDAYLRQRNAYSYQRLTPAQKRRLGEKAWRETKRAES